MLLNFYKLEVFTVAEIFYSKKYYIRLGFKD